MEDLLGFRIVGARRAATDIGLVCADAGQRDQLIVAEDRPHDHPVRQMVPARDIGVAQQECIVGRHVTAKSVQQRARREPAAAGMDRNAVRLGYDDAAGVGQEAGEIMRVVEDRAARRTRHDPSHLLGDVIQTVLHQRQCDRVERHFRSPAR